MNKDKQDEIKAKIVLSEFERQNKLDKIVSESRLHYYFIRKGNCIGCIILLIILIRSLYFDGTFYYWAFCFGIFIFTELARQNSKFEALVKLIEIENRRTKRL
jgi:hypothetical protein